ncbi:MAG: GTA head formation protein, RCAP_rcc01685 family [Alkalilacustris sp.]
MTPRRPARSVRCSHDSFDAAHARIEANERVAEERWAALEFRLCRIEAMLERLERRLWLTVYGVLGAMLTQLAISLMPGLPL